jgi:hypothetical protein
MMMHADDMYRLANDRIQERQRQAAAEHQLRQERRPERESLIERLARTYAAIAALLA